MRTYKLTIAYDGSRYQGWQRQPDTDLTILDTVFFARQVCRLDMANIFLMTAPGEAARNDNGKWFYQVNREDLWSLTDEYFNVYAEGKDRYFDRAYTLCDLHDAAQSALYFDESGKYATVYSMAALRESPIPIKPKKGT